MKKKKNNNTSKTTLAVIIIAVIAVGAFYIFSNSEQTPEQTLSEGEEQIIAEVNGNSITLGDVHRAKEVLELTSEKIITNERALEQLINDKIILQKANEQGIEVTFEEAEQNLIEQLEGTGRTLEDIKENLEGQGRNYKEEIEYARKQMTIRKFIEQTLEFPEITDEEAKIYYEQNKGKMFTGEVVPYENIAEQLKQAMAQQIQQQKVSEYVTELRENADIVYLNQNE